MATFRYLALALTLAALAGCGSGVAKPPPPETPYLSGNWQIQSAAGDPTPGILLVGSLVSSNPLVIPAGLNGTLRFTDLEPGNACGAPDAPLTFTGASTTTAINLQATTATGSAVLVNLVLPSATFAVTSGFAQVTGSGCGYARSAVTALHVGLIGGTLGGTVTVPYALPGGGVSSAKANLTLTHSDNADALGRFPVTGTFQFAGSSCSTSLTVSGYESGEALTLSSPVLLSTGLSEAVLTGTTDVTATIYTPTIVFNSGACATSYSAFNTYSGVLTKS